VRALPAWPAPRRVLIPEIVSDEPQPRWPLSLAPVAVAVVGTGGVECYRAPAAGRLGALVDLYC
jgi:hypothetical protein